MKTDLQYVKFMEKLLSVYVFVAKDFTLEIILCMSINESSSSKILSSILCILFLNDSVALSKSMVFHYRVWHLFLKKRFFFFIYFKS